MRKFLLPLFLSAGVIAGSASAPDATTQTVRGADLVKVKTIKSSRTTSAKVLAPGVVMTDTHGIKKLRSDYAPSSKLLKAKHLPFKAAENGYALSESFEGWDGENRNWTPEGWEVDMRGEADRTHSWTPEIPVEGLPAAADGNYYYAITFSDKKQDEWLISPRVKVEEGMSLSFYVYYSPMYLFNLDEEYVDWDKFSFIGEKVVTATLQVWAQAEGEDWVMLHDFADDYTDATLMDLAYSEPAGLEKKSFALTDFAGKNTKVAFRYVGSDGNTMFIDAIGIGFPALNGVSYMEPFSTLYWGFDGTEQLTGLMAPIAHQPVFAPLTWSNMTDADAEFEWSYTDPETGETATSDDQYELTVSYLPDYSDESTMRNNFILPPTLTATAPGSAPGSYTAPYVFFQAGGKAERRTAQGEFEFDLLPFAYQNSGIIYTTVDDETIGDMALPVFGYNVNSDTYWTNYSLNGETPNESDYSHLEAIANIFFPSTAPLVVHGVNVYGFGKIGDNATFTATIYGFNAEMNRDLSTMEVMATATIKGSEVLNEGPTTRGYLAFSFNFDTPAVIQATEEHPAYMIMFSGFRSEDVEYFAPLQSYMPDPNGLCLGYIYNHIDMSSQTGRPDYWNLKPMVYKENGEYVDPTGAFAIGLDAEYPWLTTASEGVALTDGNRTAHVALGSYHDGSKLTVSAPEGITATVAGRYNECVLSIEHTDTAKEIDDAITVKGHGVELSIPVKATASAGITGITADSNRTVSGIYDLCGRRVDSNTGAGVYIIRYTDGTSKKAVVK